MPSHPTLTPPGSSLGRSHTHFADKEMEALRGHVDRPAHSRSEESRAHGFPGGPGLPQAHSPGPGAYYWVKWPLISAQSHNPGAGVLRRRWARLRQTQELEADQMSQPWAETLERLNASVKHPERNWRRGCGQQAGSTQAQELL